MTKAKGDLVTVYPATDATLPGVTSRPTLADEATAARLVASRAFKYEGEGDAVEFDEAERPALDQWVSLVPHGKHYK